VSGSQIVDAEREAGDEQRVPALSGFRGAVSGTWTA
jgi:hypothetical protein